MQTYTETIGAGQTKKWTDAGNFFRLMQASGPVDVVLYRNGKVMAKAEQINASFYAKPDGGFDAVEVTSQTGQTIKVGIADGEGGENVLSGSVTIQNNNGALTNTAKAIATTSQQLLAANPNRRYLLIQNKDTAGKVYVNLGGAAATVTNGLLIGPGGSYVAEIFAPNGAIYAIGDIVNNNVVVVEG